MRSLEPPFGRQHIMEAILWAARFLNESLINLMKAKFFIAAFFWFSHFCFSNEPKTSLSRDLITPAMTEEDPAPDKRVRQASREYNGSKVYHTLYLPSDWVKGKKFPVLVEYTGNKFPPGKGSREVKDANFGYGLSSGEGFI